MKEVKVGTATVLVSDSVEVPSKAGGMNDKAVQRTVKARTGLGLACEKTAEALSKHIDRVTVPGLTPDELIAEGKAAEDIDVAVNDVNNLHTLVSQANLLLDEKAHNSLRKVLSQVRALEKFDPHIADLFPHLIEYFAKSPPDKSDDKKK